MGIQRQIHKARLDMHSVNLVQSGTVYVSEGICSTDSNWCS